MSLIFLDTPQIDLLERVRRSDPVRYRSFLDTWKGRGCVLVLTSAHAGELRRHGNPSRREGRYQVMADLAPIRTDVPVSRDTSSNRPLAFIDREIARAIVERGLATAIGLVAEELQRWTDVLPGRVDADVLDWLRLSESESYLDVENLMYQGAQFSAGAEKSRAHTKKERRLRDIPNAPLTTPEADARQAEFSKQMASLHERSQREGLPPIPADVPPMIANIFSQFLTRMSEIGPQAALLEKLPIARLNKEEVMKLPTHELVNCSIFEAMVRRFSHDILNLGEGEQEFLVRTLELSDAPGTWIKLRLRLCVRRGSHEPRPSHSYDAERLAYLPYVDLMLTDAEMAGFVRQIVNEKSSPERIRGLRPPLSISSTMDALEKSLDSLSPLID